MVKENSDFLKQIKLTQQNSATNIDNEGYVEIKLTQNTKQFSKIIKVRKLSQLILLELERAIGFLLQVAPRQGLLVLIPMFKRI